MQEIVEEVVQAKRGPYLKDDDVVFMSALLSGKTNHEAAKTAGFSLARMYRKTSDPAFLRRLAEIRQRILREVRDKLVAASTTAVDVLLELMQNGSSDSVKLGAAREVLAYTVANLDPEEDPTVSERRERLPQLTDERLRRYIEQLAESGYFANEPEFAGAFFSLRYELSKAEQHPLYHLVAPDFLVDEHEDNRLQSWRRHNFPEVHDLLLKVLRFISSVSHSGGPTLPPVA